MTPGFQVLMAMTLVAFFADASPAQAVRDQPREEPRKQAAAKIVDTLRAADELKDASQQLALLQAAADDVRRTVAANVFVADALRKAANSSAPDAGKSVRELRAALTEALGILQFEPLQESPMAEGFPPPTPVGEIRVQDYPAYRLARTDMTFIEGRAFWTLFGHIKKHDIEMTAPVEMTYSSDGAAKKAKMSFLYRTTQQGQLGVDGKVEVVDIPAQSAVSIGLRGDATKERVADAQQRLENWLKAHAAGYESIGPLRVMGYNSPFVADAKRFTEVQIPVRLKQAATPITP